MRTTVRLDDQLLAKAKRLAASRGQTLTALLEDALRAEVSRKQRPAKRKRVSLPTFSGRVREGVDLDHTAALLDLMDAGDAAH
ncbi:MAG: type II toxin-antitoxin system VapB family antitoxin [Myxococcaceae bacterium]